MPDCKVCHRCWQGAPVQKKICTKPHQKGKKISFSEEKNCTKENHHNKTSNKGWGCTFVRHFLLLVVKISVVVGCGRTYEQISAEISAK